MAAGTQIRKGYMMTGKHTIQLVPDGIRGPDWQETLSWRGYTLAEVISACIKEIRYGNEGASLFWALEMHESGNDASDFLWECLKVCALEDIGLAQPDALSIVESAHRLHQELPRNDKRRRLALTHAVLYLARTKKTRYGNELLMAMTERMADRAYRPEVPDRAVDMHTKAGKQRGRGLYHYLTQAAELKNEDPGFDHTYRDELLARYTPE